MSETENNSDERGTNKSKAKAKGQICSFCPIYRINAPIPFHEQEQEMRANSHSMETVNGNGWVTIPICSCNRNSRYKVLQLGSPQSSPNKKSKKGKMTGMSPFFLQKHLAQFFDRFACIPCQGRSRYFWPSNKRKYLIY